jgi:hypothetical protein
MRSLFIGTNMLMLGAEYAHLSISENFMQEKSLDDHCML